MAQRRFQLLTSPRLSLVLKSVVTGNGPLPYTHTVIVDLTVNVMNSRIVLEMAYGHAFEGLSLLLTLSWEDTATMGSAIP